MLQTAKSHSSAAFCPIVIDSPRQQDQDAQNWRRILALVDSEVARDDQLVLGSVDPGRGFKADSVIRLENEKRHVLLAEDFEELREETAPLFAPLSDTLF